MVDLLSLTLPTAPGQGLGDFLDELKSACSARVLGPVADASMAWVCIEEDALTATDVVVEVKGMGDDEPYYRMTYERGPSGLVVGEPVRVREVTTYEPEVDAALMSRAVLCEMAPVHAPAADGLIRGKVAQLMRVGPLFDAYSGEHLLDVTDDLLAAVVESASKGGFSIPIDYGHALYSAQASGTKAQDVPLYGRMTALEHRPGVGLFGVPEYTAAGAALLSASPGLMYLSPTLVGTMHDPATGKPIGRGLHSVSMTPTPRQDKLDSLALSRAANGAGAPQQKGPHMADNKGAGPNPADALTLERDALRGQVVELETKLREKDETAQTLSQRIEAIEAERAAEKLAAVVDGEIASAEKAGKVVPAKLRTALLAMSADVRADVLGACASRPVAERGHAATVQPADPTSPDVIRAAVALCAKTPGLGYTDALKMARGE